MNEIFFLDNVSILSPKKEIINLNFKIHTGDYFVIYGDNAAGKSLILKLFYLKLLPSKGSLFLNGKKELLSLEKEWE